MIEGLGSDGVSTDRAYLRRVAVIVGTRLLWQRLMATPPNTLPAPGWRPSPLRRCEPPVVLAVARSGRAKCVGAAPSLSTGQPRIARKRAQWLARWKGVLPLPSASHSPAQPATRLHSQPLACTNEETLLIRQGLGDFVLYQRGCPVAPGWSPHWAKQGRWTITPPKRK